MVPMVVAGVTALVGYAVASTVLLRKPELLHLKKRSFERLKACQHISHRGGAAENLENTMTAFRHAVALGTDMLEMDVHLTRDKQAVVAHDPGLARTCRVDGFIRDYTYSDLPSLCPELSVSFGGGVTRANGEDRQVPRLETVFAAFPDVPMSIDIKVDDDALVCLVANLVRKYKREAITVWGSFHNRITNKCYAQDPSIPLHTSAQRVALIYLLYFIGLLPFVPLKEGSFSIPFPRALGLAALADKPRLVKFLDWMICRPKLFRHLQARGIPLYFWVVNQESHMKEAFALGAAGVMTDRPTLLREVLKSDPQRR
uniref:GP-PDE domain-containing protein n=1 Tax=Eutreptiella gymnastica TaxID=73025 RepID=A0A7S1J5C6_9EUGL|mmetsp:Transcript_66482/g.118044  ORF Transcript_66482/g.118044 Transcript_66482/m.118044 type:complete len:315 (+) Transcript_66482:22-966(+)